jgi:hypothetical protein
VLAVAGMLLAGQRLSADALGQAHGWKFDIVHLRTGRTFQGLRLNETPGTVRFQCVRHCPSERTKLGPVTTFLRQEIRRTEWLDEKEREALKSRLKALEPASEKERIAKIKLERVPWRGQPDGGLCYSADHFVLISNAREEIVRRAAVRLEQIYDAYVRFLPPRSPKAARTQILLIASTAEYRQMLRKDVGEILNPAIYEPASNQIICATDLEKLADELERVHKKYEELRSLIKERELALQKLPHPPSETVQKLAQQRAIISKIDKENADRFAQATESLFQILYHEAFHAYLAGFVYPPGARGVPRWLNEGLAQIFESAIVEAGVLRVGHADPERLKHGKQALRAHQLVPLAELLRADPAKFLVGHATGRQVADAYYMTSWALAFYLTFGQGKLGTPELDEYVQSLSEGADPGEAFSKLAGEPVAAFETSFHRYLRALWPDGSLGSGREYALENRDP